MLLSAEKIIKSYSEKKLLEDVSLYVDRGDKIGIIGANGSGKSTFLRILAKEETPDGGTLTWYSGVQVEYLPQNPAYHEEMTVLEHVFSHKPSLRDSKEFEAKRILTQLGITEFNQTVESLSGGQRKSMALARALINPCDVLLLDEPTNHLDLNMVQWLESYLGKYTGAIVMVTHDRYFLERVVNRIVEIDGGSLYGYEANFSAYLELKAQREEMAQSSERKRQSTLRRELEWLRRGPRARGTKSKERLARFEALSEQKDPLETAKLELTPLSSRLGKKTVEIEDVSISFDGQELISNFSHMLQRDDRIGIVGKSGCGKSTLLKIIAGKLKPDSGTVVLGETVRLGYFSQDTAEMDLKCRVIDYIKEISGEIETAGGSLSASQMLEKYLFTPDMQWNTIGRLSGGERRRLYLCGILMQAPNVLLLDEPTNDLDIQTLTVLEDYLEDFDGALMVVSHDRYFLDKVADTLFAFTGGGVIEKFLSSYSEYWEESTFEHAHPKTAEHTEKVKQASAKKLRFSFNEQREYESIDAELAALEQKLKELEKLMEDSASDYIRLQELMEEKEVLDRQLEEKMERWLYLNELADKIAEEK